MLRKFLNSFTITSLILFSLALVSCKKSSSSDNSSSSDELKPLVNNITTSLAEKAKKQLHLGEEFHSCIEHYGKNPADNAEYCSPYNSSKQKIAENKERVGQGKTLEEMEEHVKSLFPLDEGVNDPQTIAQNTEDNVHVLHKINSAPADQGTEMTQIIADNIKKYPSNANKSHDFSNFFYAEEGYAGKKVRLAGF